LHLFWRRRVLYRIFNRRSRGIEGAFTVKHYFTLFQ